MAGSRTITLTVIDLSERGPAQSNPLVVNVADTLDFILDIYCEQHDIQRRPGLTWRAKDHSLLSSSHTVQELGLVDGSTVVLTQDDRDNGSYLCRNWWCLTSIAMLMGTTGIVLVSLAWILSYSLPAQYGVVIDAGSTHSELFVYQWPPQRIFRTGKVEQLFSCRAQGGGLNSYWATPQLAGDSLKECLSGAVSSVPYAELASTNLYLGATAGMRLLNMADPLAAYKIMVSVNKTLEASKFAFQSSRILLGSEEAAFGWLATNYLKDTFSAADSSTVGALDLGGASAQITFAVENRTMLPLDYSQSLTIFGRNYDIFSHSALCYGLTEAQRRLWAALLLNASSSDFTGNVNQIDNPCGPSGNSTFVNASDIFVRPCVTTDGSHYKGIFEFVGRSNPETCARVVHSLFNFTTCEYANCSFDGSYIPPLFGKYLAFSGYWYVTQFFNNTNSTLSLPSFKEGVHSFCQKSWSELDSAGFSMNDTYLSQDCFRGMYMLALLTSGYHIDDRSWSDITFINKIRNLQVGWSLGFMLNTTNLLPASQPTDALSLVAFVCLVLLFSLILLIGIFFAIQAIRSTRRRSREAYEALDE